MPVICLIIMHALEISTFFFRILSIVETKYSPEQEKKVQNLIHHMV